MLLFFDLGNTWWYFTTNTNFASDEYDIYYIDAPDYYYRVQVSIESVDYGTSEWSDELIVLTRSMLQDSVTDQELEDLKVLIVRYKVRSVEKDTKVYSKY